MLFATQAQIHQSEFVVVYASACAAHTLKGVRAYDLAGVFVVFSCFFVFCFFVLIFVF